MEERKARQCHVSHDTKNNTSRHDVSGIVTQNYHEKKSQDLTIFPEFHALANSGLDPLYGVDEST